jgi:nucleotide-binding universal stress UspA family protein
MKVVIATDGSVHADTAAEMGAALAGGQEPVTVLTVVEVPRRVIAAMRAAAEEGDGAVARQVNVGHSRVPAGDADPTHWIGDDAAIQRYVDARTTEATTELIEALEARDVAATLLTLESENTASTIIEAIEEMGTDVLIIGTHGLGRFEGLLGSISTKLARRAGCSVLLVR